MALTQFNPIAEEKEIRSFLSDEARGIKISVVEVTGSTNEDMKKRAREGEAEISLLIANGQTAGKGSKGRSFFSPDGTGVYMSFLLRPDCTAEESTLLTPMAAVATALALERVTGTEAKIKWVNDIFVSGRKVSGILTEGAAKKDGKGLDWVVVGIGINIKRPDGGFPAEIENIAGAVYEGTENLRNRIAAEVANYFVHFYKRLTERGFYEEYRKRLFILSKELTVTVADESFTATAVDLDPMFRLKIRLSDGSERLLTSGEVSVRFNAQFAMPNAQSRDS